MSDFLWPIDWSLPGSSFHDWISQAGILERVAISLSRGPTWPRDQTHVSCIADGFFYCWATGLPTVFVDSAHIPLSSMTLILTFAHNNCPLSLLRGTSALWIFTQSHSNHLRMCPLIPSDTIHVTHNCILILDILQYYLHSIHHTNKNIPFLRARVMISSFAFLLLPYSASLTSVHTFLSSLTQ